MKVTLNVDIVHDLLEVAIKHRKQVYIQYFSKIKGELTVRVVEPTQFIKTTEKEDTGVLCFDHESREWRHFKLRNIQRLTLSDYDFQFMNEE